MTIRTKVALGIALILAFVLTGMGITATTVHRQRAALNEVEKAAETVSGGSMALLRSAKDIQVDIVQVQQFLTDVSATRAQDGLDDGFKDAARFAEKFVADVEAATSVAGTLGRPGMVTLLAETKAAFAPYYDTGRRMAHAYVNEGPAGGNRMMPEFDKASETMQADVEKVLALAETAVQETTGQLGATIGLIQASGDRLLVVTILLGVLGTAVATGTGALLFFGVVRPLGVMTRAMRLLADGDLAAAVPGQGRRDEVGGMAQAVLVFRDHMMTAERLTAEQAQDRQRAEEEKRLALGAMATTIETETAHALEEVRDRTASMTAIAGEMSASADRTGVAATTAASAAAHTLSNAQIVASAAEQLAASIAEIAGQVNQSSVIVGRAVTAGVQTRTTIEDLNQEVERIGAVAQMIGEIAARTNLLALNATIEAARAGSAGKGFAVVASEVKQLADQTARSTQEIAQLLGRVRSATGASVTAVALIERTVTEINSIAVTIASAVEQQGAATAEIARNVAETAGAANEMTARTVEVSAEAADTGQHAAGVREHAASLAGAIEELRHSVIRVVRTSTAEVDRRTSERRRVDLPCRITIDHRTHPGWVVDLSETGAHVTGVRDIPEGSGGVLDIEGVRGSLAFVIRRVNGDSLHVAFSINEAASAQVREVLAKVTRRQAA